MDALPACPILDAFCGAAAGYRSSNQYPPEIIDLTDSQGSGGLGRARRLGLDNVFHQFLLHLIVIKGLNTARGDVHWLKAKNVAMADFNLEAKPVGAEQPP